MSRLALLALVFALVLGLGAACARPATAISLGGCGRAEGATDLAAQSETGRLVTAGPLGAAVYDDDTLSGPDRTRISGGIRALLFASDDGARLAVWDAGSLRVFDFRTLERLGKVRVKGLGGQTAMAARWPAQGDEVVIVGHRERGGFFGLGASREPRIARLDVTTGRSVFLMRERARNGVCCGLPELSAKYAYVRDVLYEGQEFQEARRCTADTCPPTEPCPVPDTPEWLDLCTPD